MSFLTFNSIIDLVEKWLKYGFETLPFNSIIDLLNIIILKELYVKLDTFNSIIDLQGSDYISRKALYNRSVFQFYNRSSSLSMSALCLSVGWSLSIL